MRAMPRSRSHLRLIGQAAAPAVCLLIIAYFVGAAIVGQNGLMAWGDYKQALSKRKTELSAAQGERALLEHRSALLDPRRVDPDYADELVRRRTDQVRDDEVIVPLK